MKIFALTLCVLFLTAACATRQRDNFFTLDALPAAAVHSAGQFHRQVTLRVTVPAMVDRGEMVLTSPNGVAVIDHQRWVAPLADLVKTALAQDLERRRADVVVVPSNLEKTGVPLSSVAVDIDQITARLGDQVSIEVHWRVTNASSGKTSLGRDVFSSQTHSGGFGGIATALSACIGALADRLVNELPPG